MFGIATFFAKPLVKYGAVALATVALIGGVLLYLNSVENKGRAAGKAEVTGAVQADTIKKTQDAVKAKDKADDDVSKTPYRDLIDNL